MKSITLTNKLPVIETRVLNKEVPIHHTIGIYNDLESGDGSLKLTGSYPIPAWYNHADPIKILMLSEILKLCFENDGLPRAVVLIYKNIEEPASS